MGSPTIQTAEGRIKPGTGGYSYQYDLKDHLGSVRMTFDKDPTGLARIIQEDHYYAFGGKYGMFSYDFANGNRYAYTGQEHIDEVDVYDHGARMYDHQLGRWHAVDPLAEKYYSYSTYNFVKNNPISYIDPNGMDVIDHGGGHWTINGDDIAGFLHDFTGDNGGGNGGNVENLSGWFDKQGEQLFNHWKNGKGSELILNTEEWGEYMRSSFFLEQQIFKYLWYNDAVSREKSGRIKGSFHADAATGFGYSTGYDLLGGSNANVGDLSYHGSVQLLNNGSFRYNLNFTWNDIMDPNPNYIMDIIGAKFFPGQPYTVRIQWHTTITIKPKK